MPCKSELKQFPTPTTAILILFIAGKDETSRCPTGWARQKVGIIKQMCGDATRRPANFRICRGDGTFPRSVMGILLIKGRAAREIGWMRRYGWAVIFLVASALGTRV